MRNLLYPEIRIKEEFNEFLLRVSKHQVVSSQEPMLVIMSNRFAMLKYNFIFIVLATR